MKPEHEKAFDDIVELIHQAEERCNGAECERSFWSGFVPALLVGFLLGFTLRGCASEIPTDYANRLADAIFVAEGGDLAKVPYGILSVPVKNKAEARRVCLNTIRNNWKRWEDGGKHGPFLDFLADRYCPPSVDATGNANWKRNVRWHLAKQEKQEKPQSVVRRTTVGSMKKHE